MSQLPWVLYTDQSLEQGRFLGKLKWVSMYPEMGVYVSALEWVSMYPRLCIRERCIRTFLLALLRSLDFSNLLILVM
jgi:hypothetical protein